jgi:hypothetical protein
VLRSSAALKDTIRVMTYARKEGQRLNLSKKVVQRPQTLSELHGKQITAILSLAADAYDPSLFPSTSDGREEKEVENEVEKVATLDPRCSPILKMYSDLSARYGTFTAQYLIPRSMLANLVAAVSVDQGLSDAASSIADVEDETLAQFGYRRELIRAVLR